MLLSVHTVAGMAIGQELERWPLGAVFFAGWFSHFLLDAIPHSEQPFGKEENISEKWRIWQYPRRIFLFALTDCIVAVVLLFWFGLRRGGIESPIFWGGLGAMMPDLIDNMPFWSRFTRHFVLTRGQYRLHRLFHVGEWQKSWPRYTRLLTQAVIAILALWILL